MIRGILALLVLGVLAGAFKRAPSFGVCLTFCYLALIGGIRRWLIPIAGFVGNDPLLLVVPALTIGVGLWILFGGGRVRQTKLSTKMAWLLGIMVLQVLNPLQGGVVIGVSGFLFYGVPILWYFIGRRFGNEVVLQTTCDCVIAVGVLAGIYGLWQTWVGFLPSEITWINMAGYEALNVGVIRAFSFFTSAAEYGCVLGISIVLCWAGLLKRKLRYALPLPLLAIAIILEGSRGIVVLAMFASAVLWAIQAKSKSAWFIRGGIALFIAVSGLMWTMRQVSTMNHDEKIASLVEHQVEGLTDPFAENSTGPEHFRMVAEGIFSGFKNPIGYGLGSTTNAAGKYGGVQRGTEGDFSNMFVSLGFAGGVLYLVIIFTVANGALSFWHVARSHVSLSVVGLLTVQGASWLNGGQYSTVMLIWFSIGALETTIAHYGRNRLARSRVNQAYTSSPQASA